MFTKGIHIGKNLHFYIAWGCTMRRRSKSRGVKKHKGSGITRCGGTLTCEMCGREMAARHMTIHHPLPRASFPALEDDARNQMTVCSKCHVEIHRDKLTELRLMHRAAQNIGIDLNAIINN